LLDLRDPTFKGRGGRGREKGVGKGTRMGRRKGMGRKGGEEWASWILGRW